MIKQTALVSAVLINCFAANGAHATESFDNCTGFIDSLPATLSQQGNWCMRKDLNTALGSGSAIIVNAHNVTVDCHGYKLGGLAAGAATMTVGVYSSGRANVAVRDCKIRGFRHGVMLIGNGGHLMEDNRLDGNTYVGLSATADNVTVRRNEIFDTGGATDGALTATGILLGGTGCMVRENTVSGVDVLASEEGAPSAYGIASSCEASEIRENRVSGLTYGGGGWATGIRTDGVGTRIVDNFVHGSAEVTYGTGISGEGAMTLCQRNVVTGTVFGIEYCEQDDNFFLWSE